MPISRTNWAHRLALSSLVISTSYVIALQAFRSSWYRDYLVHQLCAPKAPWRDHAAATLASMGAEAQLLEGMRHPQEDVRDAARRALDAHWFQSAGVGAARRLLQAEAASSQERHAEALQMLDEVVHAYPAFAEGWSRRAAVLWRMGRTGACLQSCERALGLNHDLYGAWLGLAHCHMQLGDSSEARRSLKAYLALQPFDLVAVDSLQKCERLAQLEEREYQLAVAGLEAAASNKPEAE